MYLSSVDDVAKYLPCKYPSQSRNVRWLVRIIPQTFYALLLIWLTWDDESSWKGPNWVWIDSNPNEVSEVIMFDMLGTDTEFERLHWLCRSKTICAEVSWFAGIVPDTFMGRDSFSSPKSILVWENWIGCKTLGKHIGCKLNPFLIDSIWYLKHKVSKSEATFCPYLSLFHSYFLLLLAIPQTKKG